MTDDTITGIHCTPNAITTVGVFKSVIYSCPRCKHEIELVQSSYYDNKMICNQCLYQQFGMQPKEKNK